MTSPPPHASVKPGAGGPRVAIGRRLNGYRGITCLGPRPSLADYPAEERRLIEAAPVIYYPTRTLAAAFKAVGKPTYPSWESHHFGQDKLRQLALFSAAGLAMPRTKVYFGRQRARIAQDFDLPLIAKTPRASALGRGVFLISDAAALARYLSRHNPAYIQEYLAEAVDVRVVVVGGELLAAYVRRPAPGEFRANLAQGARAVFGGVPQAAVDLALETARRCRLDEIGLDVLVKDGRPYLIEANLLFGRRALASAGIDLKAELHRLIVSGRIERRLGV